MAPPLRLDLDGAALVANWRWLRDRNPGAACGAAIKADGYGLGARGVLERLAAAGCRDFFVATWAEAGVLGPLPDGVSLSVLHGLREEDMAAALAGHARPVLNTPRQVALWKVGGRGRSCDVMIDTGINRLGLTSEEAVSGLLDGLAITTLHSHLACADAPDDPMNAAQLDAFRRLRAIVPAARYSLANSAGILLGSDYAFDLTRPGLALYGGAPSPGDPLSQVVHSQAQIVQLRDVAAGASVGYGALWRATAPTRIAILNVGYADGLFRRVGEGLKAVAGGRMIELLGRVSMDLIAIRAPEGAGEGDWIELPFDLPTMAARAGLSQYELLTSLGPRYQRRWT